MEQIMCPNWIRSDSVIRGPGVNAMLLQIADVVRIVVGMCDWRDPGASDQDADAQRPVPHHLGSSGIIWATLLDVEPHNPQTI
jgi:hypothetical protein